MNKVQQITQALVLSRGKVVDDHTGKEQTITAFATFASHNGTEHVVAVSKELFSITPMSVSKDGKVHLATYSVAGTVDAANHSLLQALINYNAKDRRCRFIDLHELQDDGSEKVMLVPTQGTPG